MIKSKDDYEKYLKMDKIALGKNYKRPKLFGDYIWKFEILLRKCEYYRNCKNSVFFLVYSKLLFFKLARLSLKLGFSIPINVFGPGLSIAHYGTIVVNNEAKIGKNCRIQESVTIGTTNGSSKAPILGDNIFIGSGARIIGDIEIADDIAIGANSVVNKTFSTPGITIAGVPAKKISDNNSHLNLNKNIIF